MENKKSCGQVYIPKVDNKPVPCDHYTSSDCAYMSDKFNCAGMDISPMSSLTDTLNCMMKIINDMSKEMRELKREVNHLL